LIPEAMPASWADTEDRSELTALEGLGERSAALTKLLRESRAILREAR
jgi:hypothetical protein